MLNHDPLIADYRAFFALLGWSVVDQWETERSHRGRPAHPVSAYLKAFLIRLREGMTFTTQLRRFLLRHPFLVIELGFRLVLDPTTAYGFDLEQTLPCEFWLREHLRQFDQTSWLELKSYSNRQKRSTPIGGLVGSATFEGDLLPFLDLLVGELVHVGKNVVKGDGWYKIV